MLSTSGFIAPAARPDLEAWITTYNLNVSSFIDAPGHTLGTLNALGVRETTVIVEMPSMKVVWVVHGDVTGSTASGINAATAEMHRLLGR